MALATKLAQKRQQADDLTRSSKRRKPASNAGSDRTTTTAVAAAPPRSILDPDAAAAAAKKAAARAARRRARRPTDIQDEDLNGKTSTNDALARLAPGMLADWVARRVSRFAGAGDGGGAGAGAGKKTKKNNKKEDDAGTGAGAELTPLELDGLRVDEGRIVGTDEPSWQGRVRETGLLGDFLASFAAGAKGAADGAVRSPHTLVVAGFGMRAADLVRVVKGADEEGGRKGVGKGRFGNGAVVKLFAKHIKIAEAAAMCAKTRMTIGVGTPQRILDLLDTNDSTVRAATATARRKKKGGSDSSDSGCSDSEPDDDGNELAPVLNLDNLQTLVIDASHIDAKKRGVLDHAETVVPLVKLIGRVTKESSAQILFF